MSFSEKKTKKRKVNRVKLTNLSLIYRPEYFFTSKNDIPDGIVDIVVSFYAVFTILASDPQAPLTLRIVLFNAAVVCSIATVYIITKLLKLKDSLHKLQRAGIAALFVLFVLDTYSLNLNPTFDKKDDLALVFGILIISYGVLVSFYLLFVVVEFGLITDDKRGFLFVLQNIYQQNLLENFPLFFLVILFFSFIILVAILVNLLAISRIQFPLIL